MVVQREINARRLPAASEASIRIFPAVVYSTHDSVHIVHRLHTIQYWITQTHKQVRQYRKLTTAQ